MDIRNVIFPKSGVNIICSYDSKEVFESTSTTTNTLKNEFFILEPIEDINILNFQVISTNKKTVYGEGEIDISNIKENLFQTLVLFENLGKIKLEMTHSSITILEDNAYDDLFGLLLENNMELVKMLSSVCKAPKTFAIRFIYAFEMKRSAAHLIKEMLKYEIDNTPDSNIIFRGNTLTTHSLDTFLKLIGIPYLHKVLGDHITEIYKGKKCCELDPARLQNPKHVKKNVKNLIYFCTAIIQDIFSSLNYFPSILRDIFQVMSRKLQERFNDENIKFTGPGGFFFLRFICPAILTPNLFGLAEGYPSIIISRDLTLIAKSIQNLANLTDFDDKESYLLPVNQFITDNMENMKNFLIELCSRPTAPLDELPIQHHKFNFGKEMAHIVNLITNEMGELESHFGEENEFLVKSKDICHGLDTKEKNVKKQKKKLKSLSIKRRASAGGISSELLPRDVRKTNSADRKKKKKRKQEMSKNSSNRITKTV